jgi:Mg2+/Co2+ transporter CorB
MTLVILIFAGASFFFALAETALFSLGKWQVARLAERRPGAGGIVAQLLARPQDLQATLAPTPPFSRRRCGWSLMRTGRWR